MEKDGDNNSWIYRMERIRLTKTTYCVPIASSNLYEHRENFLRRINIINRRRYSISEKSAIKFIKIDEVYINDSKNSKKYRQEFIEQKKNKENTENTKKEMQFLYSICPF